MTTVVKSRLDRSFSVTTRNGFEAHFVDREVPMVDLSSQKGCNMGCSMCHLTLNGFTKMEHAGTKDILDQIDQVVKRIPTNIPRDHLNVNMMGMGDWTLNPYYGFYEQGIVDRVLELGFKDCNIRISTPGFVQPRTSATGKTIFYWSLYTLNPEIRKKILPKAMDPEEYYSMLKWHKHVVHFPIIPGVNDSIDSIQAINYFLYPGTKINLLDYKDERGEVITTKVKALELLSERHNVKDIVSNGVDIGASCGIFTATQKKPLT